MSDYNSYSGGQDYNQHSSSQDYDSSRNNTYNSGGYKNGNQRGGSNYNQRGNYNNSGGNDNSGYTSNSSGNRNYESSKNSYDSGANAGSDIQIQKDTIFIQNLPKNVSVSDLEQNFGSIGIIKNDKRTNQAKIWIYKDKITGEGKGEATVTYDDEQAASAAIVWFNEKEVMGNIVKIQLATRKNNFNNIRGGGGGRGRGSGGDRGNRSGNNSYNRNSGGGGYGDRGNRSNNDRNDRNNGRSSGGDRYSRPAPY